MLCIANFGGPFTYNLLGEIILIIRLRTRSDFRHQECSTPAWSVAPIGFKDLPLLAALSSSSLRLLSQGLPQDLSNTAWSVSPRGFVYLPLLDAIASSALRRLRDFRPQNRVRTAWADSTLDMGAEPLLH